MIKQSFLIFCVIVSLVIARDISHYRKHIASTNFNPHVITGLPIKSEPELPYYFWWGNVNGTNHLTVKRNQLIPIFCGSCWAFASTSTISGKAQWPDINLSPQVLISCNEKGGGVMPLCETLRYASLIIDICL